MIAPFGKDGSLQHYPESWYTDEIEVVGEWPLRRREGPHWREAEPFTATLVLDGYRRGQSAAYFMWREPQSRALFPMFLTDLSNLLADSLIDRGAVFGRWDVVKRGQNYGIKRMKR